MVVLGGERTGEVPLYYEIREGDWYVVAEQSAPAPHLAHPEGRVALRMELVTVPRASRSCEHSLRKQISLNLPL